MILAKLQRVFFATQSFSLWFTLVKLSPHATSAKLESRNRQITGPLRSEYLHVTRAQKA